MCLKSIWKRVREKEISLTRFTKALHLPDTEH